MRKYVSRSIRSLLIFLRIDSLPPDLEEPSVFNDLLTPVRCGHTRCDTNRFLRVFRGLLFRYIQLKQIVDVGCTPGVCGQPKLPAICDNACFHKCLSTHSNNLTHLTPIPGKFPNCARYWCNTLLHQYTNFCP